MNRRLVASLVLSLCASAAVADSFTYSGSRSRFCISSLSGYDENLVLQPPQTAFLSSGSDELILVFNSNGTGSQTIRALTFSHGAIFPGAAPASTAEGTCSFTYTYAPESDLVTVNLGTCITTTMSGPSPHPQS